MKHLPLLSDCHEIILTDHLPAGKYSQLTPAVFFRVEKMATFIKQFFNKAKAPASQSNPIIISTLHTSGEK